MDKQVETPNPQEEAEQPNFEAGSEDEAANAFAKRDSEVDRSTETPEDEPEADADEEPGDGEPEEADAAEKLVEVEYEGKTYEVPPEIEKAVLRQADYSRKMNEVGAKEKEAQQRIETADKLIEGAEKYAKVLAKTEQIDAQLAQFEGTDWARLEAENPAQASLMGLKVLQLQQAKTNAVSEGEKLQSQLDTERAKTNDAKRGEMVKALAKDLPGWGDELGQKITQYAISKGYSVDEIRSVTDPRWVIAMDRARKFDALQESKASIKAKAKDAPPVVKPGARRPAVSNVDSAMARLKQSNSLEDAEAAFLARMR